MSRPAARAFLLPHPASPCAALAAVEVALSADDRGLAITYRLAVDPRRLRLPPQPPAAADGLWRHTCCEAFVAGAGEAAYREFNSPSGQWAAYGFSDYRERDDGFVAPPAPCITLHVEADRLELTALLAADALPPGRLQIGLAVVVEDAAGALSSYWALAHPATAPDFHRREAFLLTLDLAQAERLP